MIPNRQKFEVYSLPQACQMATQLDGLIQDMSIETDLIHSLKYAFIPGSPPTKGKLLAALWAAPIATHTYL
jgi:hypothetical protein